MKSNIPKTDKKRIVVIGGGLAGLKLCRELAKKDFQIVLIDKNNYHQFQPLLYQVATSGLEPNTIAFPFRKAFQKKDNVVIRITEVTAINTESSFIETASGRIDYDYLVVATGTDTNFFGNEKIREYSFAMKSVPEALQLRNAILECYEEALVAETEDEKAALMNIIIVGGGPTGVELAGALAEMKKYILPRDYPELDFTRLNIHILESSPRLLNGMSEEAGEKSKEFLQHLGVKLMIGTGLKDYDGKTALLSDGKSIPARIVIWAAGVTGKKIKGISEESYVKGNRLKVDRFNKVEGYQNIYAIGDISFMAEDKYPKGHPQVAQVALQQASQLAINIVLREQGKKEKEFSYHDRGSMATVGRNLAVADLPKFKFQGFFAWLVWMFVHLMSIVGFKNRVIVLIEWIWSYITYDQSLRLIIKQKAGKVQKRESVPNMEQTEVK
jgi:NADH:ubiquinone reductase (H+-translocating)